MPAVSVRRAGARRADARVAERPARRHGGSRARRARREQVHARIAPHVTRRRVRLVLSAVVAWPSPRCCSSGGCALTLRNRELASLLVVGAMTAIGFASVYIAHQAQISAGSLGYAVFFFGLYLVAHMVARFAVPFADPYLLPMAALLTAVGLTQIYRLGPERRLPAGPLDRRRRRRVRRDALLAARGLPGPGALQVRLRGPARSSSSCRRRR